MLQLRSPAKINLFLRIVGRRPDGYHELASLFQTISLYDRLDLQLALSDQLICNDPSIPTDQSNLILKAAELFRKKTTLQFGLKVSLNKQIPVQAGLGGGSSNAATTLWGLNELLGRPATLEQLTSWGAELGSDVPFFLSTGAAYCTGRGEMLQSIERLPSFPLWIVKPQEGLSTPLVYKTLNLNELQSWNPHTHLAAILEGEPAFRNDLEVPAFALLPALATLKKDLKQIGFEKVLMSGSGTAFFCVGNPREPLSDQLFSCQVHGTSRSLIGWY